MATVRFKKSDIKKWTAKAIQIKLPNVKGQGKLTAWLPLKLVHKSHKVPVYFVTISDDFTFWSNAKKSGKIKAAELAQWFK
ncbi:hypothetical protein PT287_06875 [Lactobacillus sp. ESL0679]|uniref:hypothetical protein n=1 Tax=Lactobacillus sp. ESL0679 TaxID=2983209 RepID=UPI0023F67284|nr:hypothetical protein [Lactobacillus sp. ESL0679]MDF7683248.1 hypothetical protein [Lactobacillus sp. ESL0679]